MKIKELLAPAKLMLGLPMLGLFVFYMYQPISDYYFKGSYNDNVIVLLESEILKVDDAKQMLILHIKPYNQGSVPVDITSKDKHGKLTVEIRKIDNLLDSKFLDYKNMKVVSTIDVLRNDKDGYTLEAGSYYDEVEAITLPMGFYWVNAKLTFSNDDYVDQSSVVKLVKE